MISTGGRTKLALRINRRKTVSVTPAIGARIVAGAILTLPIWRDSDTRAPCGTTVVLAGFSQNFFLGLCGFRCFGLAGIGLGVFAAEALDASGSIHQLLLAGKERVAVRADFQV